MSAQQNVVETSRRVRIANVGSLIRVELRSEDGELLGLEYRRPPARELRVDQAEALTPIPLENGAPVLAGCTR